MKRPIYRLRWRLVLAGACILACAGLFASSRPAAAATFANPAFAAEWDRLDEPVEAGVANRPFLFGTPLESHTEPFIQAPNHSRLVQYFEKGRMELTDPGANPTSPSYLGDTAIVRELVRGQMTVGQPQTLYYTGAEIPVAGDDTLAANPDAPTYRSFQSLIASATAPAIGKSVGSVLNPPIYSGFLLGIYSTSTDSALATLATNAYYEPHNGHNIPDVFWTFLTQPTADGGASLFDWQSLFGLPLTDAYWVKVRQSGQPVDVLVQLFERRTLLYLPGNPANQQIQLGNVGRHYLAWRYGQPELPVYDSYLNPQPSVNGTVTPPIGESGATFVFKGTGFTPGEGLGGWQDELGASQALPASVMQTLKVKSDGTFSLRLRTVPLLTPDLLERLVIYGKTSKRQAIFNFSIVNAARYTPGMEMREPTTVPPGISASFEQGAPAVVPMGWYTTFSATGFAPNEPLAGWLTSPLGRVSNYRSLYPQVLPLPPLPGFGDGKGAFPPEPDSFPYTLAADAGGTITMNLAAPGWPVPGIWAFTLYGTQSGHSAIIYFRVRTGLSLAFNPLSGSSLFANTGNNGQSVNPLLPVSPAQMILPSTHFATLAGED